MTKFLNKFYDFIDKIGKRNFMLLTFVLFVLIVTGLYSTFSLYTSSDGLSIIDGVKTFKFILNNDNTENSVTIAAGASKNVAITVTNEEDISLKYGIYYKSNDNLTDVDLGYRHDTEYLPNGDIEGNSDYIVTIKIDNNSSDNVTITFGTTYGLPNGGELTLESGEHWLEQKIFHLNETSVGSYVRYIGNNGCSGASCYGQNANYVSDTDMGYCYTSANKYNSNGWRVAYINGSSVRLVSGGAPECMCTNSDGTMSNSSCSTYIESEDDVHLHIDNLNKVANGYCNIGYVENGVCNETTVWTIKDSDFQTITGNTLGTCFEVSSDICGLNNILINNGSFYWYATPYDVTSSRGVFAWSPNYFYMVNSRSDDARGVRPVINLDSDVIVVGGTGTYNDPYQIENPNTIKDLSGHMNNGVLIGDVDWDKKNGTISTSSEITYVNAGLVNYNFGSNASIVIRVKFNDLTNGINIEEFFGNWESGGMGIGLKANNTVYYNAYLNSAYPEAVSTSTVTTNTWYTLVGTYNGANLILYINGVQVASTPITGNIGLSKAFFAIGGNPSVINDFVSTPSNAVYSDALIFNRTLTASEIASDYSGVVNPTNTESMILRYDFKNEFYHDSGSSGGGTGQVLSDVEVGSYVAYTGDNGCPSGHCDGTNANYENDSNMGYCRSSGYKFTVNGWRVMAKDAGGVYIVSAGAPECMCTNSDGTLSNDSCSSSINSSDIDLHINNLNAQARKYCNELYAKDATCSASTAWAMASADYQRVLGKTLEECYGISNNACGLNNTLIDNGGYYWYSTRESAEYTFLWYPNITRVNHDYSGNVFGVRPVLYLESGIEISGGSGTMSVPYQIEPYYEMEYVEGEWGEVE